MTGEPARSAGRGRPAAAFLVVAVFLAAVIATVARLPGSAPAGTSGGTGTGTTVPRPTGRAAIGVEVEVPASGSPSTTTTTVKPNATTTTVRPGLRPVTGAAVEPTLRAAGLTIVAVTTAASPPATTQIEYMPHHLGDALTVRTLLRLPAGSVSQYAGPTAGLPAGTDVIVLVGTQG